MPATGTAYPKFADSLGQKKVDIDTDTLKVMLLSAYTYSAAHQYVSDVKGAGTEATSGVYTAGGVALTSVTWTLSGSTYTLDAADTVFHASTGTNAVAAVIYDATPGTDATNPVVGYINLDGAGGTVAVKGINWHASGILTAAAS